MRLLFFLFALTPLITALHRIEAGRVMQLAHARLELLPSEAAAAANMDKCEVSRQWSGLHHVWLDVAFAEGKRVVAQVGYALLEYAGEIPELSRLQLEAASRARKRMAVAVSESEAREA